MACIFCVRAYAIAYCVSARDARPCNMQNAIVLQPDAFPFVTQDRSNCTYSPPCCSSRIKEGWTTPKDKYCLDNSRWLCPLSKTGQAPSIHADLHSQPGTETRTMASGAACTGPVRRVQRHERDQCRFGGRGRQPSSTSQHASWNLLSLSRPSAFTYLFSFPATVLSTLRPRHPLCSDGISPCVER